MDINGQRYFLLRDAEDFSHRSSRLLWDTRKQALTLAQNQELRLPASDPVNALNLWQTQQPLLHDRFGQQGRIASTGQHLEYNAGAGFLPLVDDHLQVLQPAAGSFVDAAFGGEDLLAAIYADNSSHGVLLFHLQRRWQATLALPSAALRVCIDAEDRVWCLAGTAVHLCRGTPLPHGYVPRGDRFEPQTINPTPFALQRSIALPAEDQPLAICSDAQQLLLLTHDGDGRQSILTRDLTLRQPEWTRYPLDSDCPFAIDLQIVAAGRLALLAPRQTDDSGFRQRDCPIVQLQRDDAQHRAVLLRERYPMLSQHQARFASSADGELRYQAQVQAETVEAQAGFAAHARELLPLQRPRFYSAAHASLGKVLDAGAPDTIWHRLYLEGCIPGGCRIRVFAKAYNNPQQHSATPYIEQPQWIWCRHRSDIAFGRGLVDSKPGEQGLFELLLQRNGGPVRRLSGRYLQLRLQLEGEGRNSPSVHALKVYYPRFSYQEAYLPEHMRQEYAVDAALDQQRANGADVRERLLAAFEGALTPLETLISGAEQLLSPEHTPAQHLPWLGELFGHSPAAGWPLQRQRRWISASGELQRRRGTLAGVSLALDIVTDGAVQRGELVLVENFRLRRTMATILGLDMDDSEHPLTLGTGISGNSIVGDSLILSDVNAREFLSLFAPELAEEEEQQIVERFFDQYAHRVTVLLHGRARRLRSTVEDMLQLQMPAQLEWQLVETEHPFVLGLSPLLAVDTYLETRPPFKRFTLNDSYLGAEGLLANAAALSPQDVSSGQI